MAKNRNRNRRSKDGLVSDVLRFSPKLILEDDDGKYILYCNYQHHKGIVKEPDTCRIRGCYHQQKYRLQSNKSNSWHEQIRNCAKQYYDKFF